MAQRPIFVPNVDEGSFVKKVNLIFEWHSGFSVKQKQKSIESLHEAAKIKHLSPILEISTKSHENIGKKLSAFNLFLKLDENEKISVESAYQGSKIFEKGGPYRDFFHMSGRDIKKDKRLHNSGRLIGFDFNGIRWGLEPKNAFYDWIYINALYQNQNLTKNLFKYKGFSDIEFNPNKSINCQAKAAALFVSLHRNNLINKVVSDKTQFLKIVVEDEEKTLGLNKFSQNEFKNKLLGELYSKINKWRFCTNNKEVLESSNSIVREFLAAHPDYAGMDENIKETIKQGNSDGWFGYDDCNNTVDKNYRLIEQYICSLDDDIKVKRNKNYIAFKKRKNFVCADIRPKIKKIVLYVKVNPKNITLESGFTRDVRNTSHNGTGDLEITLTSNEDLNKAFKLINMSYQSV